MYFILNFFFVYFNVGRIIFFNFIVLYFLRSIFIVFNRFGIKIDCFFKFFYLFCIFLFFKNKFFVVFLGVVFFLFNVKVLLFFIE